MAAITVRSNAREMARWLDKTVLRQQLPFATSLALNRLAKKAAGRMRGEAAKRFILRNKRVQTGIISLASHKRDWPHPKAWVGSRDEFMRLQETGGVKRSKRGSRFLTIPTVNVRPGRNVRRIVPRNRWARHLKDDPRVRKVGGGHRAALLREKGRGKKKQAETWYLLRKTVRITPRFGLRRTVADYAALHYGKEFRAALRHAMETAKPRPPK